MRPKLLDLFCGVGGAAMGYYQAGFEVVGVDIEQMNRYPFEFIQMDAMEAGSMFEAFDVIHASPPCHAYLDQTHRYRTERSYPDLIRPVRDLLMSSGKHWVIENVDTAPLRNPMMLCGTMFEGVRVIRHRAFESSIYIVAPPHPRGPHPPCFTYDKRKPQYGKLDEWEAYVTVTGGGNCSTEAARDAMGIRWAGMRGELTQAIPPAYTKYVGEKIMEACGWQPTEAITSDGADGSVRPPALSPQ